MVVKTATNLFSLPRYVSMINNIVPMRVGGRVSRLVGLTIEAQGVSAPVGMLCHIYPHRHYKCRASCQLASGSREQDVPEALATLRFTREHALATGGKDKGEKPKPKVRRGIKAEIVGFRENKALLMPLGSIDGIGPGSIVKVEDQPFRVKVGDELLGRVLNGLGEPLDGKEGLASFEWYPVHNTTPNPAFRKRISEPIATGIKAIDGLLTCGRGQRMGIFAGSGVGKSVLLGMIARNTNADINVIALIGERGREVREFIEDSLGEKGLERSIVVVSTSDEPALVRIQGAFVAITIAEYFRDQGSDVMFIMDSVTRLAMAKREVGLAIGEPPTTKGYPPSVFSMLPKFLERAGTTEHDGSITGFYTVLMEGDDVNDPVVDTVRSIIDGHILLSRKLAEQGHYPAIDVLQSISRLFPRVTTMEHRKTATEVKELLSVYNEAEDLINIGAYNAGNNPRIDRAIKHIENIKSYLRQDIFEDADFQSSVQNLLELIET